MKRGVDSKEFLLLVLVGIVFLSSVQFLSAGIYSDLNTSGVANGSGHSSDFVVYFGFNVTHMTVAESANTTFYYSTDNSTWTSISVSYFNSTTNTVNATIPITSIPDGRDVSINVTIGNATNILPGTVTISRLIIDDTPPIVALSNLTERISIYGNYSNHQILNLTANLADATNGTIQYVIFNITKNDGTQNVTYIGSRIGSTNRFWNDSSFNVSHFNDGAYNISVWVNDSLGNINSSSVFLEIRADHNYPDVTASKDTGSSSVSKIVATITSSDSGTGTDVCSVTDNNLVSFTGSGSSWTLTDTHDLSCGVSRSYTIVCSDHVAHNTTLIKTLSTNDCTGGGSGSAFSGGTATTGVSWSKSYAITTEVAEEGYTKTLKSNERVKFDISGEQHHVGVKSVSSDSVTLEIASNHPLEVTLKVGEEGRFDVNGDNVYDIYVKVNSVSGGEVDLLIRKISEPVSESVTGTPGETGVDSGQVEEGEERAGTTSPLLWIIAIIVIVLVLIGIWVGYSKNKKR